MDKLIRTIDEFRAKLGRLRKHALKETPTRTIVIDPLLESLGWDIRDPDEVQLEYPTVDGKSVDYALKINGQPVLLVEAKPLDDSLRDVKGITQVVGYAANDGIVWCVLTNGIVWQVYRSVEKCPAPDKLMYEVTLDPRDSQDMSVEQIAEQLWRLSRQEMARGTLDLLGEQTFTDAKVRKALDRIMRSPARALVNLVRKEADDDLLTPQKITDSLTRVWTKEPPSTERQSDRRKPSSEARTRHAGGRKPSKRVYDEAHHTEGKPQEVIELYRAVDRFCRSLEPVRVERTIKKMTVNYLINGRVFCCVLLQKGGIKIWLKLKYSKLPTPPGFARDVSELGHQGVGDLELTISGMPLPDAAESLIQQSFEGVCS